MIPAPGVGMGSEKDPEDPTGESEVSEESKRKKKFLTLVPGRKQHVQP